MLGGAEQPAYQQEGNRARGIIIRQRGGLNASAAFDAAQKIALNQSKFGSGVCFEDVIKAIEKGNILDNLEHKDKKRYPNQQVLIIKIKKYAYAVPYIVDRKKETIFLKTVYPSRVLTKKYLRKE